MDFSNFPSDENDMYTLIGLSGGMCLELCLSKVSDVQLSHAMNQWAEAASTASGKGNILFVLILAGVLVIVGGCNVLFKMLTV